MGVVSRPVSNVSNATVTLILCILLLRYPLVQGIYLPLLLGITATVVLLGLVCFVSKESPMLSDESG